jgi:hypothetical protein
VPLLVTGARVDAQGGCPSGLDRLVVIMDI